MDHHTCGGVAHLGERLNGIQEVVGSIPIISTNFEKNLAARFKFFFLIMFIKYFANFFLTFNTMHGIIYKHSSLNVCKKINNIAEWSSPVARRAHNPKVVGSNPASATIINPLG